MPLSQLWPHQNSVVALVTGQLWVPEGRLLTREGQWKALVPGLHQSIATHLFVPGLGHRQAGKPCAVSDASCESSNAGWQLLDATLDSAGMLRLVTADGIPQCFDVCSDFSTIRPTPFTSIAEQLLWGIDFLTTVAVLPSLTSSPSASTTVQPNAMRSPVRSGPLVRIKSADQLVEVLQLRATSYGNLFDWVDTMQILRHENYHQHYYIVKDPQLEIRKKHPIVQERTNL